MDYSEAFMENRRQHYRHAFDPHAGVSVLLRTTDGATSFFCEMVNLSIGGLCLDTEPRALNPAKNWTATFSLSPETGALQIPIEPIHTEDTPCGFRFLPRTHPREQEDQ